jgi:hypothetical protein
MDIRWPPNTLSNFLQILHVSSSSITIDAAKNGKILQ